MRGVDLDHQVRLKAFNFLESQVAVYGEVLPWQVLARGFLFEGIPIPLIGPQGIFKPQVLNLPLTITTAPIVHGRPRPYDDGFGESGLLRYRYRGRDPDHRDNVGLREIMRRNLPLIYFHGIAKGRYMTCWPAYLVHDNPSELCFSIALDDRSLARKEITLAETDEGLVRRSYVTALVRRRMHQQAFRERVLQAYREYCAVCRPRHYELLEAAHILPDTHERGEPAVSNGLSLCSLHHAAFDSNILGITPDLLVDIRGDILEEIDGPMLVHGLQEFQGKKILVPRFEIHQPNREFLAERYDLFRKAS